MPNFSQKPFPPDQHRTLRGMLVTLLWFALGVSLAVLALLVILFAFFRHHF
ncbi:hypothetical protein Dxin01_00004 [Deinococcus xinjiangensis]|uniref:DUF2474 domain-containing protein n=1 Tax=Deinococcus xinjiangensis TaxID=457454 RepID=A0ABP9V4R1_9DEIO